MVLTQNTFSNLFVYYDSCIALYHWKSFVYPLSITTAKKLASRALARLCLS